MKIFGSSFIRRFDVNPPKKPITKLIISPSQKEYAYFPDARTSPHMKTECANTFMCGDTAFEKLSRRAACSLLCAAMFETTAPTSLNRIVDIYSTPKIKNTNSFVNNRQPVRSRAMTTT